MTFFDRLKYVHWAGPEWSGQFASVAFVCFFFLVLLGSDTYPQAYAFFFFKGATTTGMGINAEVSEAGTKKSIFRYSSDLKYVYEVDGVRYQSNLLDFTYPQSYWQRHQAENKLRDYEVGQKVTVHYDQRFPSLSALSLKFSATTWLYSFLLFLGGTTCLVLFKKLGCSICIEWKSR